MSSPLYPVDTLLARLAEVDNDPHSVERLHPAIYRSLTTGEPLTQAAGIVTLVHTEFGVYSRGIRGLLLAMELRMPQYLRALIRDKAALEEALEYWREVQRKARTTQPPTP